MFVFYGMSIFISALCSFGIRIDLCTMQHLEKNLFANQNCYAETGFKVENSRMQAREKKTLNSLLNRGSSGLEISLRVQENAQIACIVLNAICAKIFCKGMNEKFVQFYQFLGIYMHN